MIGCLSVARRELLALWATPLAWVSLVAFLILQGGAYSAIVTSLATLPELSLDVGPTQAFFGQSIFPPLSMLLLCPALTMRTFSEERRSGSIELLLSAPLSASAMVIGKFLAVWLTYAAMWIFTLLYFYVLKQSGHIEWPIVASSYLAVVGIGGGILALGVLASVVTRSQLVAAMLAGGLIFALVLVGIGENILLYGWGHEVCRQLSIKSQLQEMAQGVISSRRLVFDLTLMVLPLALSVHIVDGWRRS